MMLVREKPGKHPEIVYYNSDYAADTYPTAHDEGGVFYSNFCLSLTSITSSTIALIASVYSLLGKGGSRAMIVWLTMSFLSTIFLISAAAIIVGSDSFSDRKSTSAEFCIELVDTDRTIGPAVACQFASIGACFVMIMASLSPVLWKCARLP